MCLVEFTEATCRSRFRMSKTAFLALCDLVGPTHVPTSSAECWCCHAQCHRMLHRTPGSDAERLLAGRQVSDFLWRFCGIIINRRTRKWSRSPPVSLPNGLCFLASLALRMGRMCHSSGHTARFGLTPSAGRGILQINTLAICDDTMCFRYVSTGWAGSNADAHIDGNADRA